jgi:phosphatidylethanolamine/phosphatidyl-N-methylethanolamine N-methyltransferase
MKPAPKTNSATGAGFFAEHLEFFRQYRHRFQTTGAVAPSSRFLARALARPLQQHAGPCRVLEVGPGTGAVTRRIARLLKPKTASTWWN